MSSFSRIVNGVARWFNSNAVTGRFMTFQLHLLCHFSNSIRNEGSRIDVQRREDDGSRWWNIRDFHGHRICDQMLTKRTTRNLNSPPTVGASGNFSDFARFHDFPHDYNCRPCPDVGVNDFLNFMTTILPTPLDTRSFYRLLVILRTK